jgi:thiol-disulfide isomerase/thioredoxin
MVLALPVNWGRCWKARSLTGGLALIHHVNRRALGAVLILLVGSLLAGCQKPSFTTASGQTLAWGELEGQWVLVNYWAEWCKPCLEEIPELNALDQDPDITVIGVNYDEVKGQALQDLGSRMGIRYTMIEDDPAPVLGWDTPVALPATMVLNPGGELVESRFGPQTEQQIRELTDR